MDKTTKLYQDLFKLFRNAFPKKNPAQAQTELNEIWKEKVKKSAKDKVDDEVYRVLTEGLNKIVEKRKTFSISFFFKKPMCKPKESASVEIEDVEEKKAEENDLEVLETADSEDNSDTGAVLD